MTFPAYLERGPHTKERAWAELKPVDILDDPKKWEADLNDRVNRSHYLHCRAGGLSHVQSYLRCYHGIEWDSWIYLVPLLPIWIYRRKRRADS